MVSSHNRCLYLCLPGRRPEGEADTQRFGAALALIAAAYFFTKVSRAWLFWAAFVMTRPLDATLGDLLKKPHIEGGLEFSRTVSSLMIAATIVILVVLTDRGAERGPGEIEPAT